MDDLEPEKAILRNFEELRKDLKDFVETRYEILRADITAIVTKASRAAVVFAAAAIFGLLGLILLGICISLCIALAFGAFSNQVALIWGFFITGAGNLIVAGILAAAGKSKLKSADLVPQRTLRVLQRDQEALKQKSGGEYVEPGQTRRRA